MGLIQSMGRDKYSIGTPEFDESKKDMQEPFCVYHLEG